MSYCTICASDVHRAASCPQRDRGDNTWSRLGDVVPDALKDHERPSEVAPVTDLFKCATCGRTDREVAPGERFTITRTGEDRCLDCSFEPAHRKLPITRIIRTSKGA